MHKYSDEVLEYKIMRVCFSNTDELVTHTQGSTPAPLAGKSMGTRSEASAVEASTKERHQRYQCWLPLEKTNKCVNEILTAFSSRKFEVLGSACSSAIEKMDKDCPAKTIGNFHDHLFSASVHRHCSCK